jgi:hypothetical protein
MGQNSYTLDAATLLRDSADGLETASAAETLVLDFGNTTSGPAVEQKAYTAGDLVVDFVAVESDTGDESIQIVVQLSDSATFASGVVTRAVLHHGNALGAGGVDNFTVGRLTLGIDNEHMGDVYRYMRLANVIAGTIATGFNYNAFFAEKTV